MAYNALQELQKQVPGAVFEGGVFKTPAGQFVNPLDPTTMIGDMGVAKAKASDYLALFPGQNNAVKPDASLVATPTAPTSYGVLPEGGTVSGSITAAPANAYINALKADYEKFQSDIEARQKNLDVLRQQRLAEIENLFGVETKRLSTQQEEEKKTRQALEFKLGTSGTPYAAAELKNLADEHAYELNQLQRQKQDAINKIEQAIADEDFRLAQQAREDYKTLLKEEQSASERQRQEQMDLINIQLGQQKVKSGAISEQQDLASQAAQGIFANLTGDPKQNADLIVQAAQEYGIENPNLIYNALQQYSKEEQEFGLKLGTTYYNIAKQIPEGQAYTVPGTDITIEGVAKDEPEMLDVTKTIGGNEYKIRYDLSDPMNPKELFKIDLGPKYKGTGGGTGDDEKEIAKFRAEAADLIAKLDTGAIGWGTAFDQLKIKYPLADMGTINAALGGGIPWSPETGFDTKKAWGRAAK